MKNLLLCLILINVGIYRYILVETQSTRFNENVSGRILNAQVPVTERSKKLPPGNQWIWGWKSLRDGMEAAMNSIFWLYRELKYDFLLVQLVAELLYRVSNHLTPRNKPKDGRIKKTRDVRLT